MGQYKHPDPFFIVDNFSKIKIKTQR